MFLQGVQNGNPGYYASTLQRVPSMITMLRYGSGFHGYRLKGLGESLGIPLPVATQCEILASFCVSETCLGLPCG